MYTHVQHPRGHYSSHERLQIGLRVRHVIAPGNVLQLGFQQFFDRPFVAENRPVFGETLVLGRGLRLGAHQVHHRVRRRVAKREPFDDE